MKKRVEVFLEFILWGVLVGIIEDIVVIKILTTEPISFSIIWIVLSVTIPFAFIGEYVIDKINFLNLFEINPKHRRIEVFIEFLIFGVLFGVVEDLVALYFSTGTPITWSIVGVVFIVAIPFAFIGEYLVDRINFIESLRVRKFVFKESIHE